MTAVIAINSAALVAIVLAMLNASRAWGKLEARLEMFMQATERRLQRLEDKVDNGVTV